MTEEVDLILGMTLSNCCPKKKHACVTRQLVGKMGHVGKQLFLVTAGAVPEQNAHTRPSCLLLFVLPSLLPSELCRFLAARACFCLVLISPPPPLLRLQVQIDRTGRPLVRRRHNRGLVQTRYARHNIAPALPPRFRFKYGVSVLIKRSKIVLDDFDVPGSS